MKTIVYNSYNPISAVHGILVIFVGIL